MSDWGSVACTSPVAATSCQNDYLSMLTTATLASPLYRVASTNGHATDRHFSPKRHSFADESRANDFCADENSVEDCIAFLNQGVTEIGMPSLYKDCSSSIDLVQVVNCIYDLLQKHQRSARIREDLENRQHRAEVDLGHMELVQKRLKETLRQMERDSCQLVEQDRQLNNKLKLLDTKLKAEKDEVRRLQLVMSRREAQYRHEQRRGERSVSQLRERLRVLVSDKKDRKTGIDMSGLLQRSDGKRGTWKQGGREAEEMYRLVISDHEERQKELRLENNELRQSLRGMQHELHTLITCPHESATKVTTAAWGTETTTATWGTEAITTQGAGSLQTEEISDGHFQMPYEFVRDNIEKSLKEKCRQLKMYIRKMEKQKASRTPPHSSPGSSTSRTPPHSSTICSPSKDQREMERLSLQIERYRSVIEQQEALIQRSLAAPSETAERTHATSHLWTEREMLATAQGLFNEQKENFEEERKNLTEAAIRLGRQRKAFDEEKTVFLQQQFVELTPFKERDLLVAEAVRHADGTKTKRRLPTAPSCVIEALTGHSNPRGSREGGVRATPRPYSSTPSTADLYRTLGLARELCERPRSSCSLRSGVVATTAGRGGESKGLNGRGGDKQGVKTSRLPDCDSLQKTLFTSQGQDDSD